MTYRALLATLDDWFARGAAEARGAVPCRRGCSACCHGPFDISPADAAVLAEGLAALPEPARRALGERAAAQLQRAAALLPGWRPPWDVDALAEDAFDAGCEQLASDPCPALGPDGGCELHAHRPATCRLTGLGLLAPDGDTLPNHCPIQAQFPAYAALPPTPFDLPDFEAAAEVHDAQARERGFVTTTVAGAIVTALGRTPESRPA